MLVSPVDSYSLGFGAKVMLSEKMALNVGYMWTNYHDYTKKSENYCGTNLPGTNVYSRTNKVFGLSLELRFLNLKKNLYQLEKGSCLVVRSSPFLIFCLSSGQYGALLVGVRNPIG